MPIIVIPNFESTVSSTSYQSIEKLKWLLTIRQVGAGTHGVHLVGDSFEFFSTIFLVLTGTTVYPSSNMITWFPTYARNIINKPASFLCSQKVPVVINCSGNSRESRKIQQKAIESNCALHTGTQSPISTQTFRL